MSLGAGPGCLVSYLVERAAALLILTGCYWFLSLTVSAVQLHAEEVVLRDWTPAMVRALGLRVGAGVR